MSGDTTKASASPGGLYMENDDDDDDYDDDDDEHQCTEPWAEKT